MSATADSSANLLGATNDGTWVFRAFSALFESKVSFALRVLRTSSFLGHPPNFAFLSYPAEERILPTKAANLNAGPNFGNSNQ